MKPVLMLLLCWSALAFNVVLAEVSTPAASEFQNAASLNELLQMVKQQRAQQQQKHRQREQRFLAEKNKQQRLLDQAKKQQQASLSAAAPLLEKTQANQKKIDELTSKLQQQTEDLGDLQASFRQFAGDFSASLQQSLITMEHPGRSAQLSRLAGMNAVPSIDDLETLWLLVQEEMTASASVNRFDAEVITRDGAVARQNVLRVGGFTAFSSNQFLRYVPETQELLLLGRQPPSRYVRSANEFVASQQAVAPMVIDPTRGSLLSVISYAPDIRERIEQAGTIGIIIIGLGLLGLLITLWRGVYLSVVAIKLRSQLKDIANPRGNNPLGRILKRASEFETDLEENIQFKLDELVLAELPRLERGQGFIKLLAAVAPLLGLLGTVTGMILTFQSISLFGNGDPKLMAGGISQALMTTVLGLVVAIPLLFGHNIVASLSRNLVQKLDEQSAGVLARVMEKNDA